MGRYAAGGIVPLPAHIRRARREKINFKLRKWQLIRSEMFVEADFTCQRCGWRPPGVPSDYDGRRTLYGYGRPLRCLELDHIKPKSKGGKKERENLQVLCTPCNRSKWNRQEEGL